MTDKPIAEKSATFERPLGSDPRDPDVTEEAGNVASEDILVPRADLGSDSVVFVAKGDPIPAALVSTEKPAPAPSAKAKRRKA